MRDKLVTIIMNCFNGEEFLHDSIKSVLAQTHKNWELIFWDNQSNDSTAEIFKSYDDDRFKYYYSDIHYEIVSKARNQAILKSNGDYISFLDVDDLWLPEKLSLQLEFFEKEDIGFLCSNYYLLNERKNHKKIALKEKISTQIATNALLKDYYAALVTLVIRKDILKKLDYLFDEEYHIIGDFDLVLRISALTKLGYIHKPLAILRLHESNVTIRNKELHIKEFNSWIKKNNSMDISKLDGFNYRRNWLIYTIAIYKILDGEKKIPLMLFFKLPYGRFKFRLIIALFLPLPIFKILKN